MSPQELWGWHASRRPPVRRFTLSLHQAMSLAARACVPALIHQLRFDSFQLRCTCSASAARFVCSIRLGFAADAPSVYSSLLPPGCNSHVLEVLLLPNFCTNSHVKGDSSDLTLLRRGRLAKLMNVPATTSDGERLRETAGRDGHDQRWLPRFARTAPWLVHAGAYRSDRWK